MKDLRIVNVLGGALTTEKTKEEDRSYDLEETPQFPPEAPSGATADRTEKREPQDESPGGIAKRFSFILDEPSEMMKRETRRSEDFKKLAEAKQDRDVYKNKPAGCKVKTERIDQGLQSGDREVKFADWRFDDLSRGSHLSELKKLLSSDPILKTIKPKLTGSLYDR